MGNLFDKIGRQCPKVVGFAIGRTIWGDVAEQWFQRKISDDIAISEVANKFSYLVNRWSSTY
jgi:5-dehydro-2-deoxygluconokinase